jgi:hypothetical protein
MLVVRVDKVSRTTARTVDKHGNMLAVVSKEKTISIWVEDEVFPIKILFRDTNKIRIL